MLEQPQASRHDLIADARRLDDVWSRSLTYDRPDDPGCGIRLENCAQRAWGVGRHDDVTVDEHDRASAGRQRVSDSGIAPGRKPDVLAELDQLDLSDLSQPADRVVS